MPQLLLEDRLAPISSDIGFLEIDANVAVAAYLQWQNALPRSFRWTPRTRETVHGSLEELLRRLQPLRRGEITRSLWVPTDGGWTAYFDNGAQGPDPGPPMRVLAERLGCRALRVAAVADTMDEETQRGRYGASILEVYGSLQPDGSSTERSIVAANDGGHWVFETSGEPLPFEEPAHYDAPRVQDRFPIELLDRYAHALGVRAFDSSFYAPDRRATLVKRRRRF